jgi:hypothetical protein
MRDKTGELTLGDKTGELTLGDMTGELTLGDMMGRSESSERRGIVKAVTLLYDQVLLGLLRS